MKKAFLSVLFSNAVAAGLSFFLNVFLARVLSLREFGRISLLFTLIVLLYSISDFGVCNTIVVFYNRYKERLGPTGLSRLATRYVAYLFFCVLVGLAAGTLFWKTYDLTLAEVVTILVSFFCLLLFRHNNALNQALGDWRLYNIVNISNIASKFILVVTSFAAMSLIGGFVSDYQSILAGMLLHAALILIMALSGNAVLRKRITCKAVENGLNCRLSKIFVPLGFSNLFAVVTMRFGFLIVEKRLGSESLAIYSAANILAMVVPLVTTSLMNVMIRDAAVRGSAHLKILFKRQKTYLLLLLATYVTGLTLSSHFFVLIFGSEYAEAAGVFNVLLLPYLGGVFFTPLESYFYAQKQRTVMQLSGCRMAIVIVGSMLSVSFFELYGVALSVVLSRVVGWVWIWIKAKQVVTEVNAN